MNRNDAGMEDGAPPAPPATGGREAVLAVVMSAVEELTRDWDHAFAGPIDEQTRLVGDLGLESMDFVILTGKLSQELGRRDIPFERLFLADGRRIAELRLGALVDFLWLRAAPVA